MFSEKDVRVREAIVSARADIARIIEWTSGKTLADLQSDRLVRYAVERAFIGLDAAIRDIPSALIAQYGLPAGAVAGFRNALAHSYDDMLDERVILTIRDDLPALDAQLANMLDRLR